MTEQSHDSPPKRRHRAATWAIVGGAAIALLAPLAKADTRHCTQATGPAARSAHTLTADDSARLHLVKSPGSAILEEGQATGTLPGRVAARINVGATIIATFTIHPRTGGSITGHGTGTLKGHPAEPSFGGNFTVTGGTGRYAHAHGHGGLYGTLKRSTLAVTVQTTGTLSY